MKYHITETKLKVHVYDGVNLVATYLIDYPPAVLNQDQFSQYIDNKIKELDVSNQRGGMNLSDRVIETIRNGLKSALIKVYGKSFVRGFSRGTKIEILNRCGAIIKLSTTQISISVSNQKGCKYDPRNTSWDKQEFEMNSPTLFEDVISFIKKATTRANR